MAFAVDLMRVCAKIDKIWALKIVKLICNDVETLVFQFLLDSWNKIISKIRLNFFSVLDEMKGQQNSVQKVHRFKD